MAFECATNSTAYTLTFNYYIFTGVFITPKLKQINLPNCGIKVSTTFTITSPYKATSLRCLADECVNTTMSNLLAYVFTQVSIIILKY